MCSNGRYTERGIKQVDGFMAERWRIEPDYVVRVDKGLGVLGVLLEPTTVVAKAWEQILTIGQRTFWDPQHGPGRRRRAHRAAGRADRRAARRRRPRPRPGHDRARNRPWSSSSAPPTTPGRSPTWGFSPDIVVECTGVVPLIQQAAERWRRAASCASPASARRRPGPVSATALATDVVLKNLAVFGSVNANRRHYYRAAKVLATADRAWLEQLITRRVGPTTSQHALDQDTRRHQGRHGVRGLRRAAMNALELIAACTITGATRLLLRNRNTAGPTPAAVVTATVPATSAIWCSDPRASLSPELSASGSSVASIPSTRGRTAEGRHGNRDR